MLIVPYSFQDVNLETEKSFLKSGRAGIDRKVYYLYNTVIKCIT